MFTLRVSYQTYKVTQQRALTESIERGVQQLAAENLAVRLGGVVSLGRIAHADPTVHFSIMQILAAHVRSAPSHNSPTGGRYDGPDDVRMALAIIGRRSQPNPESWRLELSYARLSNLWLAGADFSGVDFWSSSFTGCALQNVGFRNCDLPGAQFVECQMDGVNFTGADLEGVTMVNCTGLTREQFRTANNVSSGVIDALSADPTPAGLDRLALPKD